MTKKRNYQVSRMSQYGSQECTYFLQRLFREPEKSFSIPTEKYQVIALSVELEVEREDLPLFRIVWLGRVLGPLISHPVSQD